MKKYKVIVQSSIFYEVEVEAEKMSDVMDKFSNGEIDFVDAKQIDLESHLYDVKEA